MIEPSAIVVAVNVSAGGIPKFSVDAGSVRGPGLEGDAHNHEKHNSPLQALSLIDLEDLDDLRHEGFDVFPGATGENITVRGVNIDARDIGDRIRFSGGVEIELTKRRKPCYVLDAIDPELKNVIVGRCGYLAKVIAPGTIRAGETVTVISALHRRVAEATSPIEAHSA